MGELLVRLGGEVLQLLWDLWKCGKPERKAAKRATKRKLKLLKKEHRRQIKLDAKQYRLLKKKIRQLKVSDFIEGNTDN